MAALNKQKEKSAAMEKMVQQVIAKGKPWTDPDFPPDLSSIYHRRIDTQCDQGAFNKLSWKRASEIYKPVYVFEDGIEPNDIN